MKVILTSLILTISLHCFGQLQGDTLRSVSYLQLKDTTLLNNIYRLIKVMDTVNIKNSYKAGFGYIDVYITQFSKSDTLMSYYMTPQYSIINKNSPDEAYPDFYSYLNNRLILIHLNVINVISLKSLSYKSKKRLRDLVDKCFAKPRKTIFYNMDGTKAFEDKNFRLNFFPIGSGELIYILKNRTPVIVSERNQHIPE